MKSIRWIYQDLYTRITKTSHKSFSAIFHIKSEFPFLYEAGLWKKVLYGPIKEIVHVDKSMENWDRYEYIKRLTVETLDINRFQGWFQHFNNSICFGVVIDCEKGISLYENPFSTWFYRPRKRQIEYKIV